MPRMPAIELVLDARISRVAPIVQVVGTCDYCGKDVKKYEARYYGESGLLHVQSPCKDMLIRSRENETDQ